MKILFIYMGAESLGIEYLAAGARAAGHDVDLAFDPAIFGGHLMWDIPALAKNFVPSIRLRMHSGNHGNLASGGCIGYN